MLSQAKSAKDAAEGLTFMREMSKWNSMSDIENGVVPVGVKVNDKIFPAGPGHFGKVIPADETFTGTLAFANPIESCSPITNPKEITGKFAIAKRGKCTFATKVRNLQDAGAKLAIVLDNVPDSTYESTALFAMSGDGKHDIGIPAVFLFSREGDYLTDTLKSNPDLKLTVGELKSLKRVHENTCDDKDCAPVLDTKGVGDKKSFDHLKQVLRQLVTQFELSLSNDDPGYKTCGDNPETLSTYFVKDKFITNEPPMGTTPYPSTNRAAASVFPFICSFLH